VTNYTKNGRKKEKKMAQPLTGIVIEQSIRQLGFLFKREWKIDLCSWLASKISMVVNNYGKKRLLAISFQAWLSFWDRCYDFLKYFRQKIGVFDSKRKLNYAKILS
jgi:hypothetical protein